MDRDDEQLLRGRVYGADHDRPGPVPGRRYAELIGGPLDGPLPDITDRTPNETGAGVALAHRAGAFRRQRPWHRSARPNGKTSRSRRRRMQPAQVLDLMAALNTSAERHARAAANRPATPPSTNCRRRRRPPGEAVLAWAASCSADGGIRVAWSARFWESRLVPRPSALFSRVWSPDHVPWVKIPGTATDIAAGADGTAWHVNAGGEIYRYTGDRPS